jgi:hypothetical protein
MTDLGTAKVVILRADGREEEHHVGKHILLGFIQRMIGADMLDTVNLRDGRVMLVDDTGLVDGKPRNEAATKLYLAVCRPGTDAYIAGDVAVAVDADFGDL